MNKVVLKKGEKGYQLVIKTGAISKIYVELDEKEFEDLYRQLFIEHFQKEDKKMKQIQSML